MSALRLCLFSDVRRVKAEVTETLKSFGIRNLLIVDSAAPVRREGQGVFGRLCAQTGVATSVVDPLREPMTELAPFNAVYFTGGNPFRLLDAAHKSGLAERIAERAAASPDGLLVFGASAGAMVMGTDIAHARGLAPYPPLSSDAGFGWVDARVMPHFDRTGTFYDACRRRVAERPGAWLTLNEAEYIRRDHRPEPEFPTSSAFLS